MYSVRFQHGKGLQAIALCQNKSLASPSLTMGGPRHSRAGCSHKAEGFRCFALGSREKQTEEGEEEERATEY